MTNNKTPSAEEMAALFRRKMAEVDDALVRLRAEYVRLQAEQEKNDPLTLEELYAWKDPVWCACDSFDGEGGYWCLCRCGEITPPSCRPFMAKDRPNWVFYRRKPEGGGE